MTERDDEATVSVSTDTIVLIPAAGRVSDGVLSLSNISCPAMIPVAGRPVIHWTLSYLNGLGLNRFSIAVSERGLFIEDFVECTVPEEARVDFLVPSKDGGVGRTLLELAMSADAESALVVLGDTHFRFGQDTALQNRPLVLVSPVEESYRWCIAERAHTSDGTVADSESAHSEAGVLAKLHDKVSGLPGPLEALIGVYYFPDLELLRSAAAAAVETAEREECRAELAPILEAIHEETPIHVHRANEWLDCGNPDRQASSHRSLLQERAFHELTIDPVFGTITKHSEKAIDLQDEIEYFESVPDDLAVLFPRVIAQDAIAEPPRVTLEYYGYPTLSEVFLFDRLDAGIWDRIFDHLFRIVIDGFMRFPGKLAPDALTSMYLTKTRARLERLRQSPPFDELLAPGAALSVNGRPCPPWSALWPALERAVRDLEKTLKPTFVHGDLHLGNILYDVRSGICKLIDPRGRFGDRGVYGDPRYDVAKLYHSVYGLYDLIVTDLFSASMDGSDSRNGTEKHYDVELKLRSRPYHRELCSRFERLFFERFDRTEITLITGLLFVSMGPLHYDAPLRQLAMYARGMSLLTDCFPELAGGAAR